ncbi:MAG: DEAD/DEAH box helicase, partial [Paludibacteraceae bacterium]|nr:DEAD/DEAH box helicase [Paludibacteraceae bacterium]
TYQSIERIAEVQKEIGDDAYFDLIICDEAHRTTGIIDKDHDESAFVKVHDAEYLKAKRRLYMTATPRIYTDSAHKKAADSDVLLCSMDDPAIYGYEIYRIGFGEAVERQLLSDYKVLVLTLSSDQVTPELQRSLEKHSGEIDIDDAAKLIGCINALSKKTLLDSKLLNETDPEPMRRAVAFCPNIKLSKKTTEAFNNCRNAYYDVLSEDEREEIVKVEADHVDGSMGASVRDIKLQWLKDTPTDTRDCRILTNVRCLSEGVDVPSLDAVLFLSPRNSQVDVVQSVGRVMRRAEGKKYGYIIIPVVVPSDVKPEDALNDNERFKVVWTILNALRAHDDRFNATVNKIELNRKKPDNILVGGTLFGGTSSTNYASESESEYLVDGVNKRNSAIAEQLMMKFEELKAVIYAKMVQKVGNKRYWEQWAADVAKIAERHIARIKELIDTDSKAQQLFDKFLMGLHKNINPSVTRDTAIEMLAQHLITQPVFDALFENYSFTQNNAMSKSLGKMIELLNERIDEEDNRSLERFYRSVRQRAEGIDNAEAKQKIIVELYDKFFRTAFPKVVEQLGIVYTPVEVVDFIIHSVEHVLNAEFGRSFTDENVNVIDPFTGTGTFITRLLQSGLIKPEDLERKYLKEIKANEIVLLAYYIASVNIENTFHDLMGEGTAYRSFDGICLTDTFQLGEDENEDKLFSELFPQNSKRVQAQKRTPIHVVIGNPPYSVGQKSANDNAQNQSYPKLEKRIESTYVAQTSVTNKNSLYDSYIKAFRWATDRLDKKCGGVIGFITNSGWIDSNSGEGFRKSIEKEFSAIYVYNLKGAIRGRSGIAAKREGQNVFDIMTGVAITILVRKPNYEGKAKINYCEIGDFLSRKDKLSEIVKVHSIDLLTFVNLIPNEHGDWVNQRKEKFLEYILLEPERKFDIRNTSFFVVNSCGLKTQRDAWTYNFSIVSLKDIVEKSIDYYNQERVSLHNGLISTVDYSTNRINWTRAVLSDISKNKIYNFKDVVFVKAMYRPFCKQCLCYYKPLNEMMYQIPKLFPSINYENLVISVSSVGSNKGASVLISDCIVDLHFNGDTQCFPLYYYEKRNVQEQTLFDNVEDEYVRRDAVSDFILKQARAIYGPRVQKEDIFYYVYGFLHSEKYRETFAADLKKMLPRIPLVDSPQDFWAFSEAGRRLADLHLNYETIEPYRKCITVFGAYDNINYCVEKMRFVNKADKTKIQYNNQITIEKIPLEAYEYVVNGKSAIEWIMERYAITTDKASGITNDPNDWADEQNNPKYIYNLLLSIINVSVQTVEIVKSLPDVKFD